VFRLQVHSDVTHHKEIEERFILAQKREATSHLMSGLAHDFNNLLTAILVYSGLMAPKVKGDAQLQRYVEEVHNSAQRASQLVAQLLTLGRETGEPEMVDLHELVEENSDLLKRVLGEDIRLKLEADPNLKEVRAHPGRIQQVLLNLAINARDAMPGGGELLIHLSNQSPDDAPPSSPRTYVLLLVRDTGAGMDSETLANIFKPFFSTKGKDEGTGLGLFVVRTIVEQYDGRISVESEPGKGTSFKILLPAVSNAGN
jgi:two-component system, cell cycle sensor histidine kinase and response regulator CckA